jgi:tRNA-binding EMAP/Myf-like protein
MGEFLAAEPVPTVDRPLKLKVDLGEERRPAVTGWLEAIRRKSCMDARFSQKL